MWRVFLPLQGALTAVWGFHCSISARTLPTAHHDTGKGWTARGHAGFAARFQLGSVTMGPAESPVLWNSAFTLPSFFKHTISFLFPDLDYTLKHTEIIRSLGQGWAVSVPLWMQICARTCLAGWPCFKQVTNSGQQFKWNIWKETWKLEGNFSMFQQEKQGQFITRDKVLQLWNCHCILFSW